MTEEQAFALANPDGGVCAPGAFVLALGALRAEPRITEAFRRGTGRGRDQAGDHRRGVHPVPARGPDTVQPGVRGSSLTSERPALRRRRPLTCGR
jgi:hypothetical protein